MRPSAAAAARPAPAALLLAALLLAALLLAAGAAATTASAAAPSPGYAGSVDRALGIVTRAQPGDRAAARQAAATLEAGTGRDQPEILDDLGHDPPSLADARRRLAALAHAVREPARTADPAAADQALRQILSQPRYAGLGATSPLDRLGALAAFLWVAFLALLQRIAGAPVVSLAILVVAAVTTAVGGALWWRAVLGRGRGTSPRGRPAPDRLARDRFAEADRLAAAGDLAGAVCALAGAVAVALAGEAGWERSGLTVREVYRTAPDPAALGPLLLVFESAFYGGRPPDPAAHARAAAAAAAFRPAPEAAA